ncbi:Hypothetical_protein [Hexamita inflata]|uniref:Hypothetical_protein n=1 Tax=Hexamita inflata TaxID=28002 RepID=A0AA86PXX1_9EUKA|nr:Hypothetical protein HINF_LOCUS30682 [Hexamita inflata]
MERDNCSQNDLQQIFNQLHVDLSLHGVRGKLMSKCVRARAKKMLMFQTEIARFNKLLEHDEKEKHEGEIVALCQEMYLQFGIEFSPFKIMTFKSRKLDERLIGKSLTAQYETVNIAVCQYLKLLDSLTVSEAYIERLFSYLGRATENRGRDSLKMGTFESLCYLKINGTLQDALKKLQIEIQEEEV